jgi:hypothetical protein
MKTVNIGQQIKRHELEPDIDNEGRVAYRVAGFSLYDLINLNMDEVNELLADNAVVNGHLLEDLMYHFAAYDPSDNSVTIEVNADAEGWRSDDEDRS